MTAGFLEQDFLYNLAAMLGEMGETVTFRRVTTQSGSVPYPNPPILRTPLVNGAIVAGASAIGFRDALSIQGRLNAGDKFTIVGDATVYTISMAVNSASGLFSAVPFAPVAAQNEADGAAATFTFAADSAILALFTSFPFHLINGTSIQTNDRQMRFLASALVFTPVVTDQVFYAGEQYDVIEIKPMRLQGVDYAYSCHLRR